MKIKPGSFWGYSRKRVLTAGLGFFCLLWFSGCVDINDAKVQVKAPDQVDPYARNVLDKCPRHIYPHRLIVAQTGSSSLLAQNGVQLVTDQVTFDQDWGNVSVNPSDQISEVPVTGKPDVNWDHQVAYFYVVPVANSCERSKPMPDEMTTDCYSITIPLYRYMENKDCQPATSLSVFIYIFAKVSLPFGVEWHYATPVPTATPNALPTATLTPTATPTPVPEIEGEDT